MSENPALRLYNAWDAIWSINQEHNRRYRWVGKEFEECNNDERSIVAPSAARRRDAQLLDWKAGIQPFCLDTNGQRVYAFGYIESRRVADPLFMLDADGNFCLGTAFGYSSSVLTWGIFEKLSNFTFLGAGKLYLRGYNYWVTEGPSRRAWVNPRDWREHTLYFKHENSFTSEWMKLQRQGNRWVAVAAPGFGTFERTHSKLARDYTNAEEYYAKWRRKYFKEEGVPDPLATLGASETETVDYIAQHLSVYESPKARLLRHVTSG